MKKTILSLLLTLFMTSIVNAQFVAANIVSPTAFNYIRISESEHHFNFRSSFSSGSPGACYPFSSEITISNDTLYVKGFYDLRGFWPQMGCYRDDTAVYGNVIPPTVHFIKTSTNLITYDQTPPYDDETETYENVYSRVFDLALGTQNNAFRSISITPNPTKNIINIPSDIAFDHIHVINNLGQQVRKFTKNKTDQYDLESLSSGLYYIEYLKNQSKVGISKVIKQN